MCALKNLTVALHLYSLSIPVLVINFALSTKVCWSDWSSELYQRPFPHCVCSLTRILRSQAKRSSHALSRPAIPHAGLELPLSRIRGCDWLTISSAVHRVPPLTSTLNGRVASAGRVTFGVIHLSISTITRITTEAGKTSLDGSIQVTYITQSRMVRTVGNKAIVVSCLTILLIAVLISLNAQFLNYSLMNNQQ